MIRNRSINVYVKSKILMVLTHIWDYQWRDHAISAGSSIDLNKNFSDSTELLKCLTKLEKDGIG